MTQYLPQNLLALFAPRDPIPYLPPIEKLTWEKRTDGYSGLGNLIQKFEDPKDTPPPTIIETRKDRLDRMRKEKAEQIQYKLEQDIALWDPHNNESATGDPCKTLFVSRINYDTTESKLRRNFEIYGPIKKIVMVYNIKTGKPRGYAFIEYEHERGMHSARKHADGKKIDNRRVLVDVERARTTKGWLSRRLGGGLGSTRRGRPDVNENPGREDYLRRVGSARDADRMTSNNRERVDRDRDPESRHTHSREREPRDRRRRSRSRDRKRQRSRSRERDATEPEEGDNGEKRHRRSRSCDRNRRSKSREGKHGRERDRERRERIPREEEEENIIKIKKEPKDDYPDYEGSYHNNFPMKDEDNGIKYEEKEANNEIND
nr:U1 small nuclear ribonucleoprotein 70 kDa-like [Procambarus clarkii]